MRSVKSSLKKVYMSLSSWVLSVSLFISIGLLDFFLLTRTTSWESFLTDNNKFFVLLTIILGLLNNILIAIALTYLIYFFEKKVKLAKGTGSGTIIGTFLSIVSVGCAVCGGFLLPIFGIAASLTAFPFQGLEIKVLSIIVLIYAIYDMSQMIAGHLKRKRIALILGLMAVLVIYLLPHLPWKLKQNFFGSETSKSDTVNASKDNRTNLFNEINPEKGFEINAKYGDLGPKMLAAGVIDLTKLKQVYEQNGQPLTQGQLDILTKGSNEKIKITRENSYFLLNFFWAAGLANKSKALTEGDIVKYGEGQVGNFASTGGWSLSKTEPMDYYAKSDLIPMTSEQESLVEKVASNIYRPCCNNSTAFPDCNHGMALLSVLQLMSANGATEKQMFEAGKYYNAFWFPSNYYDLALYFKNKDGKNFSDVPGEIILGKEYSSGSGWSKAKQWLSDKGIIEKPPKTGGGCGV